MDKIEEPAISKQKSTDPNISNDTGSKKTNISLTTPLPNVIMLGLLFLATIAIIIGGYIHGDMHFAKVLEHLKS